MLSIKLYYFFSLIFKTNILLIGADLKHVLRTVAGSVDFKGSFRFVLADPNPHIQARNLVLLGLLLKEDYNGQSPIATTATTRAFIRALYSLHLDQATYHRLKNVMCSILDGSFQSGTHSFITKNPSILCNFQT